MMQRLPVRTSRSNTKTLEDSQNIEQKVLSVVLNLQEPLKKKSANLLSFNRLGDTANNSDSSLKSSNDDKALNKVYKKEDETNFLK